MNIGNKIRFSYKGIIAAQDKYFVLPSLENDIFVIDNTPNNYILRKIKLAKIRRHILVLHTI